MRYLIASITLFLFFVWILPLGAFIKPSQEKTACDGQRAICMCSHLAAPKSSSASGRMIYKSSGGETQKEHSGGGSSNQFLLTQNRPQINKQASFYYHQQVPLYSLLLIQSIEHIPKI